MRTKRMMVLVTLAVLGGGCQVGEPREAGGAGLDYFDPNSRPLPRPLGTYTSMDTDIFDPAAPQLVAGDFVSLTFMVDRNDEGRIQKRFHGEQMVFCSQGEGASFTVPCEPVDVNGTYEFKYGGRDRSGREYDYLILRTNVGEHRFAYRNTADYESRRLELHLRPVRTQRWIAYEYTQQLAWCESPRDCDAQELPHPRCPGAWICSASAFSSTCQYEECGPPDQTFDPLPCPPTGVACTEDCIDGQSPDGAPCRAGTLNAETCECEPL